MPEIKLKIIGLFGSVGVKGEKIRRGSSESGMAGSIKNRRFDHRAPEVPQKRLLSADY
jgi:hypothetical protein